MDLALKYIINFVSIIGALSENPMLVNILVSILVIIILRSRSRRVKIPYWWLCNPNHWALSRLLCAPRARTQFTIHNSPHVHPAPAIHNSQFTVAQFKIHRDILVSIQALLIEYTHKLKLQLLVLYLSFM